MREEERTGRVGLGREKERKSARDERCVRVNVSGKVIARERESETEAEGEGRRERERRRARTGMMVRRGTEISCCSRVPVVALKMLYVNCTLRTKGTGTDE